MARSTLTHAAVNEQSEPAPPALALVVAAFPLYLALMKLARITLLAVASMFLFFGVAILLFPVEVLKLCEIELTHPTAKMEIRAFYGGLEIGLGVYILICRARGALTDGLRLCLLLLGGILLGRVTGAAVDGLQGNYIFYTLPIEGTLFVLSYISLGKLQSE